MTAEHYGVSENDRYDSQTRIL